MHRSEVLQEEEEQEGLGERGAETEESYTPIFFELAGLSTHALSLLLHSQEPVVLRQKHSGHLFCLQCTVHGREGVRASVAVVLLWAVHVVAVGLLWAVGG